MASSGSSWPPPSQSRSFDDVLRSCDDFSVQDSVNGNRSDRSNKDFHENRMGRSLVNIYEQDNYSKDDIINSVDKCMKKYADNLLRFLEGISGRLSQLEMHCYKLERSIGEFRTDIVRDHTDVDQKMKSLDKHVQEVHRSVQILRDKQELAEAQKELAKLHMAQKECTQSEIGSKQPATETIKADDKLDVASQQLALVPSHQVVPSVALPPRTEQIKPPVHHQIPVAAAVQDQYLPNQSGPYYDQRQSFQQDRQSQAVLPQVQYVPPRSQLQDAQVPPLQPLVINQNQAPSIPQYQQQWPQQSPQQFSQQVHPQQPVQPQQPASQTQMRPQTLPSFSPYSSQPGNPVPETFGGSMLMQIPYPPTVSQHNTNRPEATNYAFGAGSSVSQPSGHPNVQRQMQPPPGQGSFVPPPGKAAYAGNASYPPSYNAQGYSSTYGYQPSNLPQGPPGNASTLHNSQMTRNHPFGEIIEKAVGMGYGRDQVANVIQRMADSGQPIDFNNLLDRLNGQYGGANQRGW